MCKRSFVRVKKVPGGKLLRVNCEIENGNITSIQISGDFFLHPENGIEKLEQSLIATSSAYEIVSANVKSILEDNKIEVVGFSNTDLAELIGRAD